jgi:hypothetical protein
MDHIKAPTLKRALRDSGEDRVEWKGGCDNVKFRGIKLFQQWSEFKSEIMEELTRDKFEAAKGMQLMIQKVRKEKKDGKDEAKNKGTQFGYSVLVMVRNPAVNWKRQGGSQQMAAPVYDRVFVTLYRLRDHSLAVGVESARLLSKELKVHQFRSAQCHRLMCASHSVSLNLQRVIRHQASKEEEDTERSTLEWHWAESMQKLLVKSMSEFSKDILRWEGSRLPVRLEEKIRKKKKKKKKKKNKNIIAP